MQSEWFIWRVVLAGHCTISEVKQHLITVEELIKLNSLMDMNEYLRG